MKTNLTIEEQFKNLNVSFDVVELPHAKCENDWPCVEFEVRFLRNGKGFQTKYSMGIGNFPIKKLKNHSWRESIEAIAIENICKGKRLIDKNQEAQIALLAWKADKTSGPKGIDVLHCLCMDAISVAQTSFEDWAAEMGYEEDSRKAEGVYKACQDIYYKLVKMFSLDEIREIASWEL